MRASKHYTIADCELWSSNCQQWKYITFITPNQTIPWRGNGKIHGDWNRPRRFPRAG